jgi:hypothetical protein
MRRLVKEKTVCRIGTLRSHAHSGRTIVSIGVVRQNPGLHVSGAIRVKQKTHLTRALISKARCLGKQDGSDS